jgi:hypothetical protein
MPDTHLPIVNFPVCFNVDPFDPAPPTPVWTDLAPLVTARQLGAARAPVRA